MNKYYKADDVIRCVAQYIMTDAKRGNSYVCGDIEDYIEFTEAILADLPTIDIRRKDRGMITEEQINEAIEYCVWRTEVGGVYICTGDIVPCTKHINDGLCHTLKELFGREVEEWIST